MILFPGIASFFISILQFLHILQINDRRLRSSEWHPMKLNSLRINDLHTLSSDPSSLLIDLRAPDDYQKKHLPSAINLPFELWQDNPQLLNKHRSRHLYLYCEYGNVSILAARLLMEAGYHVTNLTGGIHAYRGCCLRSSTHSSNTT